MYLYVKLIHIAAVIVFLGNIVTGLFWHAQAIRSRDARELGLVMRGIIVSDRWFTVPGVLVIVASGVVLAVQARLPLLGTSWIAGALGLFALSGILFAVRVSPLQRRLLALATVGSESGMFDFAAYSALARRWEFWGALALLTPLGALVLMVLKPVG